MKYLRKFLILGHRYLGIAGSLLVMMWFASGIVMMYAGGMPRLTPQLRLERATALDFSQVRLTAAEAAERAGLKRAGRATLVTVMERPAYRFAGGGGGRGAGARRGAGAGTTVFADNGERLDGVSPEAAQHIVARFAGAAPERVRHVATLDKVDQWTLGQGRDFPLYKFRVDDEDGTEAYVSPQTGEIGTLTTSRSRALAWIGTIPHWLYFGALKSNQPVWFRVVVWTSALACVIAVMGLALTFTQLRKRPSGGLSIPYSGWMRWHYITGAVFGLFTLTWAFSGLMSMEPWAWTRATGLEIKREVFTGRPADLKEFSLIDAPTWNRLSEGRAIKEVEFAQMQEEPYYIVHRAADTGAAAPKRERLHQPYGVNGEVDDDRLVISAKTLESRHEPFSVFSLTARLKNAAPGAPIADAQLLTEYDSYYYSRGQQRPLPVLRVRFDDPMRTWVYIDPEMSQIVASIHRLNRVERWLYNGLHSLDFSFWYGRRPLWDIGMITLLLGGLVSSTIGFCLGIKRMRRKTAEVLATDHIRTATATRTA